MISKLKSELAAIKKSISSFEEAVSQGFDERNLDIKYEMEKMKYESRFNARNIILLLLISSAIISQLLIGWTIYRYFDFEKQNMYQVIEIENVSDNNYTLYNRVANKSK